MSKKYNKKSAVKYYIPQAHIVENEGHWKHRLLIGTPTLGLIRHEWAMARYGVIIPTNFSHVDVVQWLSGYGPMNFLVADAQNMIVKHAIEQKFEWLLLLEDDVLIPPDTFIKFTDYMNKGDIPVVSGLYFTKSVPAEPMIYRGRGNSHYRNWKFGDKVWADGVPTGLLLINMKIIKALWDESPEYVINGQVTRRVFETPAKLTRDPESGGLLTEAGTSDLEFCTQVMKRGIFKKAGFPKFQKMKYPFLVDTGLFAAQIDHSGRKYPIVIPEEFIPGVPRK